MMTHKLSPVAYAVSQQNLYATAQKVSSPAPSSSKFSITERFQFLADFAKMVATKQANSLLVTGKGGLGKTYTVSKAIKGADTIVIKGYSTAKALYRTLYENRSKVVVFDDCDSILQDKKAINILKAALDTYETRTVTWGSDVIGSDLPRSFDFTGAIIFISNMHQDSIDQAIRSRALCVDLAMTDAEKIERMVEIGRNPEFMPEYPLNTKFEALKLISANLDKIDNLTVRTLIEITKIASTGGAWVRKAEYLLQMV